MNVKTLILTGEGLNAEEELADTFKRAGSETRIAHVNDVIERIVHLNDYHILGIPGGFSYGDHLGSGKIFSIKMLARLKRELEHFISEKKPILGICNGFQILVKMGLLPLRTLGEQTASLSFNRSGQFEDRWVHLKANPESPCIWTKEIDILYAPVRHGEGRFLTLNAAVREQMDQKQCVVLSYCDENGVPTEEYPLNPNGSVDAIAGICDETGLIFGMMPHPEAYRLEENAPSWKYQNRNTPRVNALIQGGDGGGMSIFYNGVQYVQNLYET